MSLDYLKAILKLKRKFFFLSLIGICFSLISAFTIFETQDDFTKRQSFLTKIDKSINNFEIKIIDLSISVKNFSEGPGKGDLNEKKAKLEASLESFREASKEFLKSINEYESNDLANPELLRTFDEVAISLKKFEDSTVEFISRELSDSSDKNKFLFSLNSDRLNLQALLVKTNQGITEGIKQNIEEIEKYNLYLAISSILTVLLIWLLVFRPMINTLIEQQLETTKALEKAEIAESTKNDFLANISHEIRTPMTAILGYAEILAKSEANEEEKVKAARVIDQNASYLMALIDEVLDISKLSSGNFEFDIEKTDVSNIVNEVYSLLNVKAHEKGLKLKLENFNSFPEFIFTDPKRFKQILINILGNAIKFTDEGEVNFKVGYKDGNLKVIIEDQGIGIEKDKLESLFRPFHQADTSVSRKYGGTGLGLVISKGFAQGLGGDVRILNTEVGKGTSIEISLNAGLDGMERDVKFQQKISTNICPNPNESSSLKKLDGKRVLIVDDVVENCQLFSLYLEKAGAETMIANSGTEALKVLNNSLEPERDFDVVLLDLQMPEMDGFQVIQNIQKSNFNIPVLALTAHASKEEQVKTKNAGFAFHITKPVRANELIQIVSNHIV